MNFFIKFIEYVKKNECSYDDIYNKSCKTVMVDASSYYKIFLDEAIKLSDEIFNKNIDKIYFLRQYLKNNEVSTIYRKCKKFTK